MSQTLTEHSLEELFPDLEDIFGNQDPDKCAHIIKRHSPEIGAAQVIEIAIATGTEVEALCGYRWVPKERDPADGAVCQKCVAAFNASA